MSTSSSPARSPRRRVVRDGAAAVPRATALLGLDLAEGGLARLDPARIDAAVAEGQERGYREGYEAGAARGRAEAAAEWGSRLAAVVTAGDAAIAESLSGLRAVADATAQRVARVAFELAEAIVGRELALSTSPGRDAIVRALAVAPEEVELQLHLHPDDAAALGAGDLPAGRPITIVADPTIGVGDCVARAGATTVDARVRPALERVRAVLEGAG
jgi:flagellar assembly protein FliH